ncbi:exported hypothetical protein [Verrucomicrobia bacterium]|nr:exported hypothetical protein [Verrucomicrobiota bacterium]
MNCKLALLGAAMLLVAGNPARGQPLPNNFWPNSTFESGTNLDQTNGTPTGWVQNGSDPTICQVTTNNYVSPTHAIMVNDNDSLNYGEWDAYVSLAGIANPGDTINVRYSEMWSVQDGEMRVAVVFLDASNNAISAGQFVVSGDSPGWQGSIETSTFTLTNQTLVVPLGAVTVNVGIVSGGSEATTGLLVVDDLYLARAPVPQLLPGNFWPNPSFELGSNLDQTNGVPTGWNTYNSGSSIICQVTTNNYVSASHALALVDNDPLNYGSWYSDQVSLTGHASPGDTLSVQWFQLYSITNDNMRVTFSFYNAGGSDVSDVSFQVTGNSPGWEGAVAGSGFTKVNQLVTVPPNATKLLVQLVSGGGPDTTGIMLMDDLSVAPPQAPAVLPGNFWPNPGFESGANLNQTNGTPTGWVRNGDDPTICQVTTNNYTSPTHALALIDSETSNYGEWDADLALSTNNAVPGDLLDIQYSALYSVTNGPMRLSVLFFDVHSNVLSATDFNVTGQSSGWQGAIAGSTFTLETQQVLVPANSVRMRFALVSGGPELATGVLVIDDLSAAVHVVPPLPPTVLAGNFFPNPTFEQGVQLDNPTLGIPAGGWQRGGSSSLIDQITTNNWTSPTHSLELLDGDEANYGEWYMFLNLSGLVTDNDAVDIQWFQLYSVTNGSMRLSFAFLDSGNNTLFGIDFNTSPDGTNSGWNGSVATSSFETQFQRLAVPVGTTQLRVNFASGGSSSVTGVMLIDDLSVRLSKPYISAITGQSGNFNLTWNSMASKNYTVQFTGSLWPSPIWTALATNIPGTFPTTSYSDTASHGGRQGYYRILQQ